MISFYYIRGISLTDTPFFETLEQQELFFQDYKVFDYGEAFMPPHFTNELVVYSEELDYENGMDFNTKINYVSLDYNNKRYYYFISDMLYEGEGSIRLYLTMDTIQTYMFNIEYTNARIERRSIKRWNNDGSINRDYIREHFGNDIFSTIYYKDYTKEYQNNKFCGWFIIKHLINDDLYRLDRTTVYYTDNDTTKEYTEGSSIRLLPAKNISLTNFENVINIYYNKGDSEFEDQYKTSFGVGDYMLNQIQGDPNTIDIYYIGYNPFEEITTEYSVINDTLSYVIDIEDDSEKSNIKRKNIAPSGTQDPFKEVLLDVYKTEILDKEINYSFNFNKENTLGVLFNINQVPQLLDENYYHIYFGERQDFTSYPLCKLLNNNVLCKHNFDLFTGSRYYWIVSNEDNDDVYLTKITVDKKDDVLMFNDVWKQYIASNKGTMAIKDTMSVYNSLSEGAKNFPSYKPFTKAGKLSKRFLSSFKKGAKKTISKSNDLIDLIEERVNLTNTPRTLKQGSTYTDTLFGKGSDIILSVEEVSNIKDVATIYESIGYKVDQFVQGSPIFNDRQIYNYIKCYDINLDLDILSTNEIIEDIEDRYINGIRYWNPNNLKLLSLELGEVCKYDNIESE